MSRLFTDSANMLNTTIAAYDSGPWSMFAWVHLDGTTGGGFGRVFHIGAGTNGQSIANGVGLNACAKQLFDTTPMEFGANVYDGTWRFTVFNYDGSSQPPDDDGGTSNDQCALFVGDVSTSMAQVDTVQADTNAGAGARTTGLVDLYVGNRASANRGWNGGIFCIGFVPYMMDIATAESLRQGDMTVLLDFADPIFVFGLEGSDLSTHSGYGPSYTLTDTSTSTDTDPITLTWDVIPDHDIFGTLNKQTNRLLAGGGTPAAAVVRQANKVLAGASTPTGTLPRQTSRRLVGSA